jgi:hypothetical protein
MLNQGHYIKKRSCHRLKLQIHSHLSLAIAFLTSTPRNTASKKDDPALSPVTPPPTSTTKITQHRWIRRCWRHLSPHSSLWKGLKHGTWPHLCHRSRITTQQTCNTQWHTPNQRLPYTPILRCHRISHALTASHYQNVPYQQQALITRQTQAVIGWKACKTACTAPIWESMAVLICAHRITNR